MARGAAGGALYKPGKPLAEIARDADAFMSAWTGMQG